jgi:hypothetical protein
MDLLNHYGPAVQAISAVLSLLVTAALCWATFRYVSLTAKYVELTRLIIQAPALQIAQERYRDFSKIIKLLGVIRVIQTTLDQLLAAPLFYRRGVDVERRRSSDPSTDT